MSNPDPFVTLISQHIKADLKPIMEHLKKIDDALLYVRSQQGQVFEKATDEKIKRLIRTEFTNALDEYVVGRLFERRVKEAVQKALCSILGDHLNRVDT